MLNVNGGCLVAASSDLVQEVVRGGFERHGAREARLVVLGSRQYMARVLVEHVLDCDGATLIDSSSELNRAIGLTHEKQVFAADSGETVCHHDC